MYTINLNNGTVTRDSDGKVVAPCQSNQDADFIAYIEWIEAGISPTIIPHYQGPDGIT